MSGRLIQIKCGVIPCKKKRCVRLKSRMCEEHLAAQLQRKLNAKGNEYTLSSMMEVTTGKIPVTQLKMSVRVALKDVLKQEDDLLEKQYDQERT